MASVTADSLRISDLSHFKHMVGTHSTVLRVGVDGELTPAGGWPLHVGMPIHEVLNGPGASAFDEACATVIATRQTAVFETSAFGPAGQVTITPVLDDHSDTCRYLVCWIREPQKVDQPNLGDLRPDEIQMQWRRRSVGGRLVVEAAPVWVLPNGTRFDLWEHAEYLVTLGLGRMVVGRLLHNACELFGEQAASGFGLCVSLPVDGLLDGIVPTAFGMFRSISLPAERLTMSVPVAVAVDDNRRSALMHLQALGIRLEVQGTGQLAKALFGLDERYEAGDVEPVNTNALQGPWVSTIKEALVAIETKV